MPLNLAGTDCVAPACVSSRRVPKEALQGAGLNYNPLERPVANDTQLFAIFALSLLQIIDVVSPAGQPQEPGGRGSRGWPGGVTWH